MILRFLGFGLLAAVLGLLPIDKLAHAAGKGLKISVGKEFRHARDYRAERNRGKKWIDADTEALLIYGADGTVQKRIKGKFRLRDEGAGTRVRLSKNRRIALLEDQVPVPPESFKAQWKIVDAAGNSKPIALETKGTMWPAPNGDYLVGVRYEGYLTDGALLFYEPNGEQRAVKQVFRWGGMPRIIFSEDGRYGVLVQQGRQVDRTAGTAAEMGGLAIFGPDGTIVGSHEQQDWNPVGPTDSAGNPNVRIAVEIKKVFLVTSSGELECFDFSGKRLWSKRVWENDTQGVGISVDPDAGRVLAFRFGAAASVVSSIDVDTGRVLNRRPVDIRGENKPGKWLHFEMSRLGSKTCLAYKNATGKGSATRNGIQVYDPNAEMVGEHDFPASFDEIIPGRDDEFGVVAGESVRTFKVEKEK